MAEKRKLLQEVDKTYKKVDEGIEIFEEIMTKMYEANSENQRDKFQDDLKREIKKLQRLRDLIKGWQFSSDIKDKDNLTKYRRLIETKMETFKDIERENKTKPHSKQGLSAEEKLDPREKEKAEAIEWFKTKIRQIQDEVDRTEVKMEAALSAGSGRKRKGKDESSKEKIEELKKHIEGLTYHITNLEVCMRLVTNDQKDPKEVMDVLQDALDNYVDALDPDSDMDPKECDPFGVYEELEIEEYIPQLAGVVTTSIDDEKDENSGTRSNNHSPFPEERPRNLSNEKPAAPVTTKLSSQQASEERTSISSPPPIATPPPSIPYNAVAAGVHLKSPAPVTAAAAPSSPAPTVSAATIVKPPAPAPPTPVSVPVPISPPSQTSIIRETPVTVPDTVRFQHPVPESPKPIAEPINNVAEPQIPMTPTRPPSLLTQNLPQSLMSPQPPPLSSLRSLNLERVIPNSPVLPTHSSRSNESQITQSSTQSITNAPPTMMEDSLIREFNPHSDANSDNRSSDIPSWLGVSPLGRRELSADEQMHIKRLEDAHRTMPHRFDSEPQRPAMPRIPYQGFPSYPQIQQPLFQTLDYYLRLSPETLLFIFYYMEGSKAQLLAAQALKKLSWRFHTKYLMWFQRHEEPKIITDDYEQGSYVYFDFERWAQRKKDAFMFEYRYLEDRDLTTLL
uniref:CCR4-NOT transcription complex subunit 3 n=1 Tax=Panagrolaimus superbus TaxID=310955 RepID=A0A914YXS9_9BILA